MCTGIICFIYVLVWVIRAAISSSIKSVVICSPFVIIRPLNEVINVSIYIHFFFLQFCHIDIKVFLLSFKRIVKFVLAEILIKVFLTVFKNNNLLF